MSVPGLILLRPYHWDRLSQSEEKPVPGINITPTRRS